MSRKKKAPIRSFLPDPKLKSMTIVPVGLTEHREGLMDIQSVNSQYAKRFINSLEDFKQISLVLGDKAVHYHGSSNKQTEAKNRFIEDESIRYFLGNPQSAGAGVDGLQAVCDRGLYYSNSDNSIDRWQSEDRIHRAGTVGWVVLTDLQAKGSPDTVIRRRHSTKRFLSQMTLGDLKEALNEIEQN